MSLGLRLLRRAQTESCRATELSLVSGGRPRRIQRWMSASHDPTSTTQQPVNQTKPSTPDRDTTWPEEHSESKAELSRRRTQSSIHASHDPTSTTQRPVDPAEPPELGQDETSPGRLSEFDSSKYLLSSRKRIEWEIRKAEGLLPQRWSQGHVELMESLSPRSSEPALRRGARKLNDDVRKQQLYASRRMQADKPVYSWEQTLDFLKKHTPDFGTLYEFRVFLRGKSGVEARRAFSGWYYNIGQIEARHEAKIQVEELSATTEDLALAISGTERAVRASLLEITQAVGRLTAVRVRDLQLRQLLADPLPGDPLPGFRTNLRVLEDDESELETKGDMTMEIERQEPELLFGTEMYERYTLRRRADAIKQPVSWTRSSFEEYVAALAYSRIRRAEHFKIYGTGPTHQHVVGRILEYLFLAEDTKTVISVPALKIALFFLQNHGLGYRAVARKIFSRAESLDLPLDTAAYSLFLRGASQNQDLDNYNNILRTMVRKGYYPKSGAWIAFTEMTKLPSAKEHVMAIIREKGLDRSEFLNTWAKGESAMAELERGLEARDSQSFNVKDWAQKMDKKHGLPWLHQKSLRRAVIALARRGRVDDARALLEYSTGRAFAGDPPTLNTMITYGSRIYDHLDILKLWETHWPQIKPDAIAYKQLFQIAWTKFCPNMIRVIWRYGVHYERVSPEMNYKLSKLLRTETATGKIERYRPWANMIFGSAELDASRTAETDSVTTRQMARQHREQTEGKRPSLELSEALHKAYAMDQEIHRRTKTNKSLTKEEMQELTVAIPLEDVSEDVLEDVLEDGSEDGPVDKHAQGT